MLIASSPLAMNFRSLIFSAEIDLIVMLALKLQFSPLPQHLSVLNGTRDLMTSTGLLSGVSGLNNV